MSDHEFTNYRERFEKAAAELGWRKHTHKVHHERDWDCSWTETGWCNEQGEFLFYESDLSEGLCKEIIAIAEIEIGRSRR